MPRRRKDDSMEHLHTLIDYGVLGLLLVMSLIAVAVAAERWLVYRATRIVTFANRKELELHLTRKLHLIATIGANAPYIGLLGTVLGIMLTFYDIGATGFDTTKIMTGLALALKATALGLLVAIPAVTFYNLLLRRCKVLLIQWDIRHGRERV
jgi:biopolymer transport protein ExbB